MTASKRTRFEVFKRDGFKCQYCGRTPPLVVLQVDHVIPASKGGSNHKDNLVTACFDCNSGKSNISLDQIIPAAVIELELAKERLAQMRAYSRLSKQVDKELKLQSEDIYKILSSWYLDPPEDRSIRHFLKSLSFDEVRDAAEIAVSRQGFNKVGTWKYFCGVCWRKIKGDSRG